MVFVDWNHTGGGVVSLDASRKYSGNSSLKMTNSSGTYVTPVMTHDTFLEPRTQVILWVYRQFGTDLLINHSSYGNASLSPSVNTWTKYKVTFWYDIGSNTKWGRIEKLVDSSWVQQGNDTDFGSGSPSAGSMALSAKANSLYSTWFDEVEVYS